MYGYPGMPKSPYGLPIPPKKRGRPTDKARLEAVQGDLFLAELIILKQCVVPGNSAESLKRLGYDLEQLDRDNPFNAWLEKS